MKYLRKFDSVSAMTAAIQSRKIGFIGLAYDGDKADVRSIAAPPDPKIPFYIDVRGTVTFYKTEGLQMSRDRKTWTDTIDGDSPTGKTYFRVKEDQTSPLRPFWDENDNSDYDIGGNINSLVTVDFENNTKCYFFESYFAWMRKLKSAGKLILPATTLAGYCYMQMFEYCTSLTTPPELPATTLAEDCYDNMFKRCTSLTTAPELPATTLASYCYYGMFGNCSSLTAAPELPATTLATSCYQSMFSGCTSLTTTPSLPATILTDACYLGMFGNCSSLTAAPELPSTTLAEECYDSMFWGCTSLTTAPELPATTLANWCYRYMFQNCTSLTTAPELPATTLVDLCYQSMFNGCTKLNYIKCLATNISANKCTTDWVKGVSANGTFIKNVANENWSTGVNGIPSGWVVQNDSNIFLEQNLNVATITISDLDEGTGYYTINGGSHISVGNGKTTIPITQEMNGQTLLTYGEFDGEPLEKTLTLSWTDYSPSVTITETNNYVTITSATADTIQYKLGSSGSFTVYTEPVYISADTTIYVQATKTVSGVDYTTNTSQDVTHEVIPPTNLVISCVSNTVTITADNATTIEYNFDGSSSYTTYTEPFEITQTVTVYAKASNVDSSITALQECEYYKTAIPFYVEDISGSVNTVQIKKYNSKAPTLTVEKSTDRITWQTIGRTSTIAITATVPANGKLYLRCNANAWATSATICNTISVTGDCNVGGNTMSLLYGSNFTGNETTFPSGSTYTFQYLFYNNSKLIKASELLLPATTLTNNCYEFMFQGCTSLTTAPELPATTLASYCYSDMFDGCTSLTTAPAILPATTLANNCYLFMFAGCTSLTTAPALPATTLANGCYQSMFKNCTSLTAAPELPATTLAQYCYSGMFYNCKLLTAAPELPATTLTEYCYQAMFVNCTSLTTAPALPATTLAIRCYYGMFQGCTLLTTAPGILPATTLANNCYENMFDGCTSLTTAPELPATTMTNTCYDHMFRNCTSLTTAPELPATTLANKCYENMFEGCTSLTKAPDLPATTLVNACYDQMFYNCTNINYIKCLATDISASGCLTNWVYGVSSTGTFVKNPNMLGWTTGTNGIPSGWTTQDAQ